MEVMALLQVLSNSEGITRVHVADESMYWGAEATETSITRRLLPGAYFTHFTHFTHQPSQFCNENSVVIPTSIEQSTMAKKDKNSDPMLNYYGVVEVGFRETPSCDRDFLGRSSDRSNQDRCIAR
jgi:hypothetical protein